MNSPSIHFTLFALLTLCLSLFEVAQATDQPSFECPEIVLVSVAANLDIHIPLATYQSITGTSTVWVEFKFQGIDKDNDYIWRLHDYGTYLTSCTVLNSALVSTNLDIHIPSADYQSLEGNSNIWTDLKFKGIDADGYYIWRLHDYGFNKTETASQVVQGFQDELLNVMQQGDKLNFDQRFDQLKPAVLKSHDLPKITRVVISKEWKKLTTEQKKELIQKISTLFIASYAHDYNSFSGESFKVESVKQLSPGQIDVHTFLVLSDDKDVSMDYLLKKTGDDWRIINTITNGVSDLASKRSEYVAVLKKSGVDVLLAELSAKIDKLSQ